MTITKKLANKIIGGTGYWIPGLNKSGRVRVINEGGDYMFTANSYNSAAKRCMEHSLAEIRGYKAYEQAGRHEVTYAKYVDAAFKIITPAKWKEIVSLAKKGK